MNSLSTLNLGLWEKVATFADIIPKLVYMLYASVAAAVDALQALVRKLAGLDYYFQTVSGSSNLVSNTDPLTEFIYGILGFGNSAPLYQALNTVFWSFAIFGLIVLAVSTMAALIKSHYNEDTGQTSPWKYLYTAGKAIVTFAIIPVVVIIGLQITSFVLRTLDNITAGSGGESEVRTMFGRNVADNVLQSHELIGQDAGQSGTENITYTNYDLFGAGDPSSTSTFSGMLFRAAGYNANRVRTGAYSIDAARNLMVINGQNLLGNSDSDYPTSGSNDERREYIAEQVDFLFANNVYLRTSYSYSQLVSNSNDVAPVWSVTDWFNTGGGSISSFTKFNTSLVWIFYNLWQFNYIVGFVGVMTVFSIMISIVLGMMSRLIKGAALFLVYPALLGLAPLDNFKAFKSWGQNFMQQLMMAFGSIIGINLLMLILPYVQNISFFGEGVVDVIVQLIMLVTGLLMARDFISLVNGFVGGADVMSAGEGAKGSIGGKLKMGIKPVANIAGTGVRLAGKGAKLVANAGINTVKGRINANRVASSARKANKAVEKETKHREEAGKQNRIFNDLVNSLKTGDKNDKISSKQRENYNEKVKEINKGEDDLVKKYKKQGMSEEHAKDRAHEETTKKIDDYTKKFVQSELGGKGLLKERDKNIKKADKAEFKHTDLADTYKLKKEDGKYSKSKETVKLEKDAEKEFSRGLRKDMGEMAKTFIDGCIKTVKNTGSLFGLDKALGGAKEVLGESLSFKGGVFEEYGKKVKEDKDKAKATEKESKAAETQSNILSSTQAQTEALKDLTSTMRSLLKSSQDSEATQRATQKSVEKLANSLRTPPTNSGNTNP